MSNKIRREVLNAFKKLHRTRMHVFSGDERALQAGREEINMNFRKNKEEADQTEIKKMIQLALDVEKELRTNIIQAVEKSEGVYELRISNETTRLDNVPFNPNAVLLNRNKRPRRNNPVGCDEHNSRPVEQSAQPSCCGKGGNTNTANTK